MTLFTREIWQHKICIIHARCNNYWCRLWAFYLNFGWQMLHLNQNILLLIACNVEIKSTVREGRGAASWWEGLREGKTIVIDPVPFQCKIRDKTPMFLSRSKSRPDPAIPAVFRPERPGSIPGVPFRVQNKKKLKKKKKNSTHTLYISKNKKLKS